jgi:hypothetical protein
MVPVLIIVGLFVVYELMNSANTLGVNVAPRAVAAPAQAASVSPALIGSSVGVGLQGAQMALSSAGSSLAGAVPIVGGVFSAIFGALMAASAKRAAEAKNENAAVAAAVPGYDNGVTQIVAAYCDGQITEAETETLLNQLMVNYWSEVTPQIQPGRNGCSGGTSCPGPANPNSSMNVATTAPRTYCSGSIGAACCVGCSNLQLGVSNMEYAVRQADANGGSVKALIPQVFPSKYGGTARAQYMVIFTKPSAAASAGMTAQTFLQSIGL